MSTLNTYSHLSFHKNLLLPFNESNKGRHLFVALEMSLLRAATLLVRLCTSLVLPKDCISIKAYIFPKLASMPRCLTINPRNFPKAMPNAHLRGFSFIRYVLRILNVSVKMGDMVRCNFGLDEHVVNLNLHGLVDLFFEHHVD